MMRDAASERFKIMWDRQERKIPAWTEMRDNFAPGRGVFEEREGGDRSKKSARRINSSPVKIAEEFAAGMQSGLASPGRNWFSLTLPDKLLMTVERVKAWVGQCEEIMTARFLQSNFYDSFVDFMAEQGIFGTAVMLIEEDETDAVRFRTLTAGEFALDADRRGRVCRLARKMRLTPQQLAGTFGEDALPEEIRNALRRRETRVSPAVYDVCGLIQPNERFETDTPGPKGMAWQSLWWMPGFEEPDFLRVSGYREFPAVAGRWKTVGDDVYGRLHPGETALGDAAALQLLERDARGALERTVTPPMMAPSGLVGDLDLRPGKVTFYDGMPGQAPGILPAYSVSFDFRSAEAKIQQLEAHIERAFYVDLFRTWTSFRRQGVTATQVLAEEREKSYILAPITMRQTSEVLDRVIIRVFGLLDAAHLLPPPPEEMSGGTLRIEYVSEFAMLQKRAQRDGIDSLIAVAGQLAQLQASAGKPPDVLDRIDADEAIEIISDMYGVKSGIVLGDDAVVGLRAERAERERQAQMMQMAQAGADIAPKLAGAAQDMAATPAGGSSALEAFAQAVNGGGAAGEG
jgi:hypothetical protein